MRLYKATLVVTFLFFVGCTSYKGTGEFEETLSTDYQPYDEELWVIEKADELHSEIEAKGLLYNDEKYVDFLESVKHSLLFEHPALAQSTNLYFVRAIEVNAFALPNGNIYLNSGLVAAIPESEELIAIVAHELAHIQKRHSLQAVISLKNTLISAHVADLFMFGLGLPYFGALASVTSFSREQETEADLYAISLLNSSSYEARSLIDAFDRMQSNSALKHVKHSVYSTHPSFTKRIHRLRSEIEQNISHINQTSPSIDHTPLEVDYDHIREALILDVIHAQLRDRLFFSTLYLLGTFDLERADKQQKALHDYYQAESNRGIYDYPETAAREKFWLDTGKRKLDKKVLAEVNNQRDQHFHLAIEHYQKALTGDSTGNVKAHKKMAELYESKGEAEAAVEHYQAYLVAEPFALDSRQVEIKLSRMIKN